MNMFNYAALCLGALLLGAAFLLFLWNLFFLLRAETAEGEIINRDNSGSNDESGSEVTFAMIRFTTKDGQSVEFKGLESIGGPISFLADIYSDLILKKDANKVTVVYDPHNPKRARIKSTLNLFFWPIALGAIGLIICTAGILPIEKIKNFLQPLGI